MMCIEQDVLQRPLVDKDVMKSWKCNLYWFWFYLCLIPFHQAEYSELVETLLSSQRDAVIYQRLAEAFNKLTASSTPPTMDRKQKVAFLKSLEEFVANVGGLLCMK